MYVSVGIIVARVLYESETWSLTLRQELGLRVFENMLGKAFSKKTA
jgi:hypothetical protein